MNVRYLYWYHHPWLTFEWDTRDCDLLLRYSSLHNLRVDFLTHRVIIFIVWTNIEANLRDYCRHWQKRRSNTWHLLWAQRMLSIFIFVFPLPPRLIDTSRNNTGSRGEFEFSSFCQSSRGQPAAQSLGSLL